MKNPDITDYLQHWAKELHLLELLEKAYQDAGI
jgi:hypothetical protein